MFTSRKKGKSQLVLFVLDSFANRNYWNFPFFRQVPSYSRIQTKGQKAGSHFSLDPSLLFGSTWKNLLNIRNEPDPQTKPVCQGPQWKSQTPKGPKTDEVWS